VGFIDANEDGMPFNALEMKTIWTYVTAFLRTKSETRH
jgi:hypothetical protein